MLGAGVTMTLEDVAFVLSVTEVATIVAVIFAETDAASAVVPVNVPQAVPVHVAPDMLQLTPAPLESLATIAV
jgi:hypothetical protein